MTSQNPIPDDSQPTEPLPASGKDQPTEPPPPPPPSTPQGPPDQAPYGQYAGPYPGAKAPGQPQDFFTWIRSHGIQRSSERWIGGVAGGIAQRMGVDPLIVRGIFIVLTLFAGIGVLLYGLAWAFLPEPDGRIHVQEAGAGRWSTGMTGSLITTVMGLTGLGGGVWGWRGNGFGGFLWTVFWVGGAIYLVYYLTQRNRSRNGATMSTTAYPAGAGGNAAFAAAYPTTPYPSQYSAPDSTPTGSGPYAPTPPSGTNPPSGPNPPFGGGPYGGGYQPQQGPSSAPKVRPGGPGAPAVAITAGAALLVGGGLKALDAGNVINLGTSANAIIWASAAAVLGLGILLAGLRGRTSGVLGFFAIVALVIGGIFNVVGNGDRVRFQQVDWTPASLEQAREGFAVTAGRGTVDLTALGQNAPLSSDVVVPLDVTASNVTVVIPNTVPVDIKADMTLGNLNEGKSHRGGVSTRESTYNTDKPGSHLVIQIDGTVSNVTIQEGH